LQTYPVTLADGTAAVVPLAQLAAALAADSVGCCLA
jgi:hypothetical protein